MWLKRMVYECVEGWMGADVFNDMIISFSTALLFCLHFINHLDSGNTQLTKIQDNIRVSC